MTDIDTSGPQADIAAEPPVLETPEVDDAEVNIWKSKGALVVLGTSVPEKKGRQVVIVQGTRQTKDGPAVIASGYPGTGDAYFRADPLVEFPESVQDRVFTLGGNVRQGGFRGLSDKQGVVSVGPAHPAYAAVNIAYLHGARSITVAGLSQDEQRLLQPWFDQINSDRGPDLPEENRVEITIA